jgi:ubiquinone/menaquinone biosynthesis C-methylase UbiE
LSISLDFSLETLTMEHNELIRREFAKQAAGFGDTGLTLSRKDILGWIVDTLPLHENFRVLDVAAGTGLLSRAIAPHVLEVVAIDITPEMLAEARMEAARSNLENISIEEGNAEDLPYNDDFFDFVVSRLAIHHFKRPRVQFSEMVRVCKPFHSIGVIDILSPDESVADFYNHLERLRDPSHSVALSKKQMINLMGDVGLAVDTFETREIKVDFQRWVQMAGTEPDTVELIRAELMQDVTKKTTTGMRPFLEKGSLKFYQVWSIAIGTKIDTG